LGLALIIRIRESFDTIEEDEIFDIEQKMAEHATSTSGER